MAAEPREPIEDSRVPWCPAVGVHVGLQLVAFSAAWTLQPEGWLSRGQWASFGLIGLAVLVGGACKLRRGAGRVALRALLALGGATALYLAYDPQLASLPGLAGISAGPLAELEPSLAHVGVLIAAIFLGVYAAVDRRTVLGRVAFRNAVVTAAVLVLALAGIMWLGLHGIYDLSGTTGIAMLAFRVVSFTLVLVTCLTLSGAPGVGAVAHLYVGAALLIAVARNL